MIFRDSPFWNDSAYVRIYDGSNTLVATPWVEYGNQHPEDWDGPWTQWQFTAPGTDTYTIVFGVANAGNSAMDTYDFFDANYDAIPNQIPTLSEWGMIVLSLLCIGIAVCTIRRRNRTA